MDTADTQNYPPLPSNLDLEITCLPGGVQVTFKHNGTQFHVNANFEKLRGKGGQAAKLAGFLKAIKNSDDEVNNDDFGADDHNSEVDDDEPEMGKDTSNEDINSIPGNDINTGEDDTISELGEDEDLFGDDPLNENDDLPGDYDPFGDLLGADFGSFELNSYDEWAAPWSAIIQLKNWITDAVAELVHRLAPQHLEPGAQSKPATLLERFSQPPHAIFLTNIDGKLRAVQDEYDANLYGDARPRTPIVEKFPDIWKSTNRPSQFCVHCELGSSDDNGENSSGTPEECNHLLKLGPILQRSNVPAVPFIKASELQEILPGQSLVERKTTGEFFYFKPLFLRFIRTAQYEELERYIPIVQANEVLEKPPFCYSTARYLRIRGLVVWDDGVMMKPEKGGKLDWVMGYVMEYIPSGVALSAKMADASWEKKLDWYLQIEATVNCLHVNDIVIGGISMDSVMIGEDNEPVVTFGKGYSDKVYDKGLEDTKAGDYIDMEDLRKAMGVIVPN